MSSTTTAESRRHLGWALSDGSRLVNPRQLEPTQLKLRQWVAVDGHAYRITNLRAVGARGRLVELLRHAPVYVRAGETLTAFEIDPPAADDTPTVPAPAPTPSRHKRRRAAPGAGQTAPGRRGG
jgi:hypothetical protein